MTPITKAAAGAQIAVQAAPVIIDLVRLAEEAFTEPGAGPRKLAFIEDFLKNAQTPESLAQWDDFWRASRVIIDATVQLSKLIGAFRQS